MLRAGRALSSAAPACGERPQAGACLRAGLPARTRTRARLYGVQQLQAGDPHLEASDRVVRRALLGVNQRLQESKGARATQFQLIC